MRISPLPSFAGLVACWALVASISHAEPESDASRNSEYFSIDVRPLIEKATPEHVVSDRPITKHAWYQKDNHPRVVVPPGSEAFLLIPVTETRTSPATASSEPSSKANH